MDRPGNPSMNPKDFLGEKKVKQIQKRDLVRLGIKPSDPREKESILLEKINNSGQWKRHWTGPTKPFREWKEETRKNRE